jgi:hypothetical protein
MPKVKRITNLSREARRRVTTDQVLPSPSTRKSNTTKQDSNVVVEQIDVHATTDIDRDKTKAISSDETNVKKNIPTTTSTKNKNKDNDDNDDEPGTKPSQPSLSRGQRKRQAKHEKFLKKEKMILSSLMLKKQDEQKKRIDGLDAIKQALMDTTTTADKKKQYDSTNNSNSNNELEIHHVSSNKAKRKLVGGEVENMSLILQHPAYKKDPFETLQEHLLNSYKEDKTTQEKLSKQRTQKEKQEKDAKLREKKDIVKKKTQKKKYKPRRNK